ncbi:hypothetical protein DSM104299_03713 [Baekduia alba]|nr:hypothetical protein DSM104299_03713 [Baekduia alba]
MTLRLQADGAAAGKPFTRVLTVKKATKKTKHR